MRSVVQSLKPVTRGPRRPTESELRKVGVEIVSADPFVLGCTACGKRWAPCIRGGGGVFRGYWHCPQGCNADLVIQPAVRT